MFGTNSTGKRTGGLAACLVATLLLASCSSLDGGLAYHPNPTGSITVVVEPTNTTGVPSTATTIAPPTEAPSTATMVPLPTATTVPSPTEAPPPPTETSMPVPGDTPPPDATDTPQSLSPGGRTGLVLAASDHPYNKNYNNTWLLSNTKDDLGATRIHFSRVDLEKDVDWLIIMDGKDAEIQRVTGDFQDGMWSEPVPGTLIKLRLITDGSVQNWGFVADDLESVSYESLAYSPHPYPSGSDLDKGLQWDFNNLAAPADGMRVHFSRVDLEENVDWIVVMDLTDSPYQWITGHHPEGLWSLSVPGNGMKIKLISDRSVQDWGFNVDKLESAPPQPAQPRQEHRESMAESKHNYESTIEVWKLVNPNPEAVFTKVHFSRVDMRDGELVLLDGNDKRVQTFSRMDESDFWSDDIPGRVVKIQLDGRGYYSAWGFRIDQLADGSSKASLAESKHNYEGETQTWTLVNSNTQSAFTKVHFSRVDMRDGELVLLNGNDERVQTFSRMDESDFWSDDIPGRVVKIQLDGRGYYSAWGFRIDQLADGGPR